MGLIRNIAFRLIFHPIGAVLILMAGAGAWFGEAYVIDGARRWALWHRWCARHLLGIFWEGRNSLDQGQALYVLKHESMFEAVETLALFERPVVVMKQELLDLPFWGFASRKHGSIGVDREAGSAAMRRMMKEAKRARDTGRPIVLFPEGTRVPHGESPPLKAGLAGLYKMLALPVIPVALDAGRFWGRGFVRRAGQPHLLVGDPIPPGLPREEIEARVHAAINALNAGGVSPGN